MLEQRIYKVDGVGNGRAHANEETNVFIVKRQDQEPRRCDATSAPGHLQSCND